MELLMTYYSPFSVTITFLVFVTKKSEMHDSLHAKLTEGMKYTQRFIFGISQGKAGSENKA
jgi:hypothetical protein